MSRKEEIKFTTLLRICTDETPSMVGRTAGTVAILERFICLYASCRDISCKMCGQN